MDTTAQFFAPSSNGYSQNPKEVTMNLNKKYSKKALACLEQMSQGNLPTRAEFAAAWNAGLINTTEEGERIILETVYNRYVIS